ncbi:hypothetical protein BDR05DRAFT_996464 [Suillus weaverae]|nr:hypothetical protein BDR05DRAFT_996464 [Suillus weaverae]
MQNKCEAWLKKPPIYPLPVVQSLIMEKYSFVDHSTHPAPEFTTHEDKWASIISKCVSPLLPLLSAWVSLDVQDTFYNAFCAEQVCQAGLMTQLLVTNSHHAYPCNIRLELLVLQAKMHCTKAEVDLYTVAIEIAHERDSPGALPSSSKFIPPPQRDELCYYSKDHETDFDDLDNFEFD